MKLSNTKCPKCKKRLLILDEDIKERPKYDVDTGMILLDGFDIDYVGYCPRCDLIYKGKKITKV